jgi:hypothetical protein
VAAAAQKAFNPIEYKNDFTVLAQRNPEEAADVALKWRERFMNQARGMQETTGALLEIGIAGGTAALAGWMDGGYEAERQKAIEDWQATGASEAETDIEAHPEPWDHPEGVSDPTKLFGVVDKVLVGTLVIAALAIFNVFGSKYTPLLRSSALGGFAYWLGNMTRSMANTRKTDELNAAPAEDEA